MIHHNATRYGALIAIVCDACGAECPTDETTRGEARFQARGWGWTFKQGQDACDTCAETALERAAFEAGRFADRAN